MTSSLGATPASEHVPSTHRSGLFILLLRLLETRPLLI